MHLNLVLSGLGVTALASAMLDRFQVRRSQHALQAGKLREVLPRADGLCLARPVLKGMSAFVESTSRMLHVGLRMSSSMLCNCRRG